MGILTGRARPPLAKPGGNLRFAAGETGAHTGAGGWGRKCGPRPARADRPPPSATRAAMVYAEAARAVATFPHLDLASMIERTAAVRGEPVAVVEGDLAGSDPTACWAQEIDSAGLVVCNWIVADAKLDDVAFAGGARHELGHMYFLDQVPAAVGGLLSLRAMGPRDSSAVRLVRRRACDGGPAVELRAELFALLAARCDTSTVGGLLRTFRAGRR